MGRRAALPATFYARPVLEVAHDLVGCVVRHGACAGRIVETEAYHHSEPACHAFVGRTPRTETLFARPGTAYVYRSYGIHALLNAVCEDERTGAAALIRALEPLEGLDAMRERRGGPAPPPHWAGAGQPTQALAIGLDCNATSLVTGPVRIERSPADAPQLEVVLGPRIGITKATDLPWRFCVAGSPDVSRPRPPGFSRSVR
jgi:DNA-3-methyladenine glycosylase